MTFSVTTTPYGRPALEALAEAVRAAKAGEPLAPVTVVVPSNHAGVTARRALAAGVAGPLTPGSGGMVGVNLLTVHRLAEMLGAPSLAGGGRRPVSAPVLAAALRAALETAPGMFAPVATHPATEEALVSTYTELADLADPMLDALAAASSRAAEVVRLVRAARTRLAAGWYDESDLMQAAVANLSGEGAGAGADAAGGALGELIVHLPQDLPQRATRLLRELARGRPTTVIAGVTGQDPADGDVHRAVARIDPATGDEGGPPPSGDPVPPVPARPRTPPATGSSWPVDPATTTVVTTSDADEEVRAAVRAVVRGARDGVPLERMAVLFPSARPYGRLLHQQLDAADIPVNGPSVRPLAESVTGRALTDLLALRDRHYRRGDVLDLLTAAPVRTPSGSPAPTAVWERLSRDAAVVARREHWDRRLASLATHLDDRAGTSPGAAALADQARTLRELVLHLIDELEGAAPPAPWRQRVRWLRRLRDRLVGGPSAWEDWPQPERGAAQRVDAALDRLATLDEIEPDCSFATFRRTLALELDADLGRVGRFGEGVLAGPLAHAIGLDLDLVVVVGGAEGLLPALPADDSLLPDGDRRQAPGALPLRRDHPQRQRRQLHAALAAAGRQVITSPRGDLRASSDRTMSRWVEEILQGGGGTVTRHDVPSFAHGVAHTSFPATGQEHRLARPPATGDDEVLDTGRALLAARAGPRFTRYDGNVGRADRHAPTGEVISATRLETWAACPHAYFVRYLLGIEPVEDPAEQMWISPLDRGSLVHEALERFVRRVLERPEDRRPPPEEAWSPADHEDLAATTAALCDRYEERGTVGRRLFWSRDRERIVTGLDRFLREDDRQRHARGTRPVDVELGFGLDGAPTPPAEVPLPDGRTLHMRGAIDRVDVAADGTLHVIDYKTGSPRAYRGLSTTNPHERGTRLQLAVYGVAARTALDAPSAPVVTEYWFVDQGGGLTTIGYELTDDVLARVGDDVATIVDSIAAGVFPAHPTGSASDPFVRCRYCDPDGLGVADLRRSWERKRHDPALAAYVGLAEPDLRGEEATA